MEGRASSRPFNERRAPLNEKSINISDVINLPLDTKEQKKAVDDKTLIHHQRK